jgi:DNA polymerase III delta prime subunit
MSLWQEFSKNFKNIINDIEEYNKILNFAVNYNNNMLFYSQSGFPFDLFIDEVIKEKFKTTQIYRTENIWNKTIIYNENQYFLEIDLDNPMMPKKLNCLKDMLLFIIKTRSVNSDKHLIIIKNIDKLDEYFFAFRIILEKYHNNCYFICTSNHISKIENPIKSRFSLFRFRLFKNQEIQEIFLKYLNVKLNKFLITTDTNQGCRNIIFAIFIAQTEINEPLLITEDFCKLNYPPLKKFLETKYDLNDIRQLAYKYSQYDLNIKELTLDLLKLNKKKGRELLIINNSIKFEQLLLESNKGREPIFIEALLNQLLI